MGRRPALALLLSVAVAGCGSDSSSVPSTGSGADDEGVGGGGGDQGGEGATGGEGEGEARPDPDCLIGQVLQDGQCLERCGTNGPVCDPDSELCVVYDGDRSCRPKCGQTTGSCTVGELCMVLQGTGAVEGFCAAGDCQAGSHPGDDGWCVCDTGDIPPPEMACQVVLCGAGNPNGQCVDPNHICFSGECR